MHKLAEQVECVWSSLKARPACVYADAGFPPAAHTAQRPEHLHTIALVIMGILKLLLNVFITPWWKVFLTISVQQFPTEVFFIFDLNYSGINI